MAIGRLQKPAGVTKTDYARSVAPTPLPGRVQTALQQRRPRAMHRHALRMTLRLAALVLGDSGVMVIAHNIGKFVAARADWHLFGAQPLAALGGTNLRFFVPAVLLSLLVTGSYVRHSRTQASIRVLRGSLLAAALVSLASTQTARVANLSVLLPLWSALILVGISIARALAERVLAETFARARLAAPAVLIGASASDSVPGEEETSLPDRDYRVVCTIPLELFERA